jgi:hypothetical protein
MLLVLDDQDIVHLFALKDGAFFLRPGEEAMRWHTSEVKVTVRPGPRRVVMPVDISDQSVTLTAAGVGMRGAHQRAALELIEQTSGDARPLG